MPDTATQERAESEQVTGDALDEAAGGQAEDVLEEAAVKPVAEPLEEAAGAPAEQAAEEAVEQAAESVDEPAAAAVQEPVDESVQEPVEQPPAEPVEERAGGRRALGIGEEEAAAHPIEFLSSIEVEAAAELGRAELTIGEVLGLRPGSVVQLNKMLGEPAELMVKDKLIARGEVVVVEDRFGLRITEVVARDTE